jgi:hypothetical protein
MAWQPVWYVNIHKRRIRKTIISFFFFEDWPCIDENVDLTYDNDDIRLCTIQRSKPRQLIDITFYYYRQDQFYYIRLRHDYESTLAYRAGLRNFDRIISINGINVEQYTPKQYAEFFKAQRHLPVQMLVCNPATYAYYKSNDIPLHENLPTVQRLRPVFDQSCRRNLVFVSI